MPTPLPGSVEYFFTEVAKHLRANAQGEVRCIVLTGTSTKQFWIASMVDDLVWQWGMLRAADENTSFAYRRNLEAGREAVEQELKEQQLKAMETPEGKPQ